MRQSCSLVISLLIVMTPCFAKVAQADLVGYWPFDGDAAAVVGMDGVPLNGPIAPALDRLGMPNGALSFAGASQQYVDIPGGGGLEGAGVGTISMWVQWLGAGQDAACCGGAVGPVLSRQQNGVFSDNIIALDGPDPVTANVTWRQSGAGGPNTITGTTPVGGDYHHVAVAFSTFGSELYLDGSLQGTGIGPALNAGFDTPLSIGAWSGDGAGFATANIDDVAIFDDFLSGNQIMSLADGSATPETVGPGGPGPQPPMPGIPVVSAYPSSEFTGDGRLAVSAVNGAGLQPDGGHVTAPPGGTMWLTAQDDPNPFLGFDLGSVHALDSVRIWNYNEAANPTCCLGRGIAQLDVMVAGEDGVFSTHIAGQTLAQAPGTATDFSETLSLSGTEARYVLFSNTTNHGDPSFTGLSEVQFDGSPAPGDVGEVPLPATIHAVSSNLAGFDRNADYIVNGNGKFANWHSITPDGRMWLNQGSFAGGEPDLEPEITFDLGEVKQLDRMKVWNYNEILPGREDLLERGVRLADILVAGEDLVFTTLIEDQVFVLAPGMADVDFAQVIDLMGAEARYIKFDIDISAGVGDNDFVGLSEVQFFQVPEPGGALMLLIGLACLSARRLSACRRQRS